MKVSTERIPNAQMVLTIEADQEEMDRSMERAYQRVVNRTLVPGFRKGKAPRVMLERFVGHGVLLEEAIDLLVPDLYKRALEEQSVDAIDQPQIDVTQLEPVAFKATVPMAPTVNLGNYKEIHRDAPVISVTDEDVDRVIERLRGQNAPWEAVERPVAFGDLITLDVKGTIDAQSFIDDRDNQYIVMEGLGLPVPGVPEQLVGIAKDETKEFDLTIPDDYAQQEMAGQTAHFVVTVKEVKGRALPELTDEWVKSLGESYDTVEALRAEVRRQMEERAESDAQGRLAEDLVDELISISELEYPPVLVEREIDHVVTDYLEQVGQGRLGLEQYLRETKRSESDLREEARPIAERRLKRELVLQKLSEAEGVEATQEEIEANISNMAKDSGNEEAIQQFFSTDERRTPISNVIVRRKTLERMIALATGTAEAEAPVEAATPKSGRGRTRERPAEEVPEGASADEPVETQETSQD